MRASAIIPWLIVGGLVAWSVRDALRPDPDPSAPLLAAIDSLRSRGDSLSRANESLAASVLLSAAREDSARSMALRAEAQNLARIEAATRRTQEATETLRASLSEAQAVQLAQIEAGWAEVVMAKDELLASANALIATYQDGIASRDLLIAGLQAELANEVAIGSQLTAANAALADALASKRRQGWVERGGAALAVLGVLLIR